VPGGFRPGPLPPAPLRTAPFPPWNPRGGPSGGPRGAAQQDPGTLCDSVPSKETPALQSRRGEGGRGPGSPAPHGRRWGSGFRSPLPGFYAERGGEPGAGERSHRRPRDRGRRKSIGRGDDGEGGEGRHGRGARPPLDHGWVTVSRVRVWGSVRSLEYQCLGSAIIVPLDKLVPRQCALGMRHIF